MAATEISHVMTAGSMALSLQTVEIGERLLASAASSDT